MKPTMNSLDLKLQEMAGRIRDLREIEGLTESYMAEETGVSLEEYRACEAGECDLNFAFIYRCAQIFRVDVTDIIEGSSPRLANYTLTRAGEGQHIEHAHGMTYFNMAPHFKKRVAEPLYVLAEYSDEAQLRPIEVTSHEGQECDIVLQGQLKVQVGEHIEILNPGDTIYYNSTAPHGMIATGGKDCIFYAIVLNSAEDIPLPAKEKKLERRAVPGEEREKRIWEDFIDVAERVRTLPRGRTGLSSPSPSRTRTTSTSPSTWWMSWPGGSRRSWLCSMWTRIRWSGASPSRTSQGPAIGRPTILRVWA